MNIHHIVPFIGEKASGPAHTVPALCQELSKQKATVCLHVLDQHHQQKRSFKIISYPRKNFIRTLGFSPSMARSLKQISKTADIIHNHSLWMMPNIYPGFFIKPNNHCKLITSPRGTLSPWAWNRSKWKKQIVWRLGQKKAMHNTSCFHATSEEEIFDIRRLGFKQPIALIPNGVYLPEQHPKKNEKRQQKKLLFLARIHPTKGIPYLLAAWQQIQTKFPDWELCIVGPGDNSYFIKMKKLAKQLKLSRISFSGPMYDIAKRDMFFSSDLYVLPTHTENFGISIAEALAHRIPVITTKGAPWGDLVEKKCGWWIDIGTEPLVNCLYEAMSLPDATLQNLGDNGRKWMSQAFSWESIGKKMYRTYKWILTNTDKPTWILE